MMSPVMTVVPFIYKRNQWALVLLLFRNLYLKMALIVFQIVKINNLYVLHEVLGLQPSEEPPLEQLPLRANWIL